MRKKVSKRRFLAILLGASTIMSVGCGQNETPADAKLLGEVARGHELNKVEFNSLDTTCEYDFKFVFSDGRENAYVRNIVPRILRDYDLVELSGALPEGVSPIDIASVDEELFLENLEEFHELESVEDVNFARLIHYDTGKVVFGPASSRLPRNSHSGAVDGEFNAIEKVEIWEHSCSN